MNKYKKFIVALVGFAVIAGSTYFGSTPPEWFNPLIALLTSLGVYGARNGN